MADLNDLTDRHQKKADRVSECSRQSAFSDRAPELISEAEMHAETVVHLRAYQQLLDAIGSHEDLMRTVQLMQERLRPVTTWTLAHIEYVRRIADAVEETP